MVSHILVFGAVDQIMVITNRITKNHTSNHPQTDNTFERTGLKLDPSLYRHRQARIIQTDEESPNRPHPHRDNDGVTALSHTRNTHPMLLFQFVSYS
jgi:hypothetical protein